MDFIDARICPKCRSKHTRITDSRVNPHDGYLIRYRECKRCKTRFRTYEIRASEWEKLNRVLEDALVFSQKLHERLDKA